MRASTKSYAEFRKLQENIIRKNRGDDQAEADPDEELSDAPSVSAEEITEDELPESPDQERRPLTRVLQLVKPVDTRWNSTYFMIQR
jgi:hypothetical protein